MSTVERRRAILTPSRQDSLAATAAERAAAIAQTLDYLGRTGLTVVDFARRINYSPVTLRFFLKDRYDSVGADDTHIRRAIAAFIAAHPIEPVTAVAGELYETANVRAIRATFQKLLPRPVAYMIYAPPGSQKTFCLENEVARLNREEIGRNGHGRRAFYIYARQEMTPRALMRRVATACGVHVSGEIDGILQNLRFEFRARRVLLVVDEAQHLDIRGLETLRELLDQPPHMSLLLAGSHDLKEKFDRLSATLEQWNSRIIQKVRLPGLEREEAVAIVRREVGHLLDAMPAAVAERKIAQIVQKATTRDAFEKGRTYINVRTLTNGLNQIRATQAEKEAIA